MKKISRRAINSSSGEISGDPNWLFSGQTSLKYTLTVYQIILQGLVAQLGLKMWGLGYCLAQYPSNRDGTRAAGSKSMLGMTWGRDHNRK